MQSQQNETCEIDIIIYRYFEKIMCYGIKIFRITGNKSEFNKVEIKEVNDNKDKSDCSGPDHKTGEERCLCLVDADISDRTCKPVLDLNPDSPYNMY